MNNFLQIPFEEYKKIDAVSRSDLINIGKSVKHYLAGKNNLLNETESMKFGRMVHKLLLEEHDFWKEYFVSEKVRKAGKEWDLVLEKAEGKEVVWKEDFELLLKIKEELLENKIINEKGFFENPQSEKTAVWTDVDFDVKCKCRFDIVRMKEVNSIIDLKTCCDLSINQFQNDAFRYKYHVQAAFYMDAFEAVTGKKCDFFILVVIEKKVPYSNAVFYMEKDSDEIHLGRIEYKELLSKYKKASLSGFASSYDFTELKMPAWYLKSQL